MRILPRSFIAVVLLLATLPTPSRAQNDAPQDYISDLMHGGVGQEPVATWPDMIPRSHRGFLAYRKPGMALRVLREYVLGEERFDPARILPDVEPRNNSWTVDPNRNR